MVRIRLTRKGRKSRPFYRVVAADSRSPRDGKFIEILGTYDPGTGTPPKGLKKNPSSIHLKLDRIDHWLSHGAQPSDTVAALIKKTRALAAESPAKDSEVEGASA